MINFLEKIKSNAYQNEKIAYCVNNESISFEKLYCEAEKSADYLKKQGNEPVIIYGHKSINMIISILACLLARRAYVPVDVLTPIKRVKKIIEISGATLLIRNEPINISCIQNCDINNLYRYKDNNVVSSNNDVAYIIFTSGSTGEPKGVPISYNNLNNFCNWIGSINPLNSYRNINVLNQASFSFDLSVTDLYYALCYNHTLVGLDSNQANDFKEMFYTIKNAKINLMVITPTFIKLCLLDDSFDEQEFSDIKCIYFCGEQLEVKVVKKLYDRFPNIQIIDAYGPTEATSAVSSIVINRDMLKSDILPVGDMQHNATEIVIENDEIVLKGPSVFSGYLSNIKGGYYCEKGINCYRTGDIGYIESNKLYCKGRKDSQIKYKGYRIELMEIENCLKNINGVLDAIVVCKKNNDIVSLIKGFVILENNVQLDDINTELQSKLPVYMIPKSIKVLESFPLNNNGKIDRKLMEDL